MFAFVPFGFEFALCADGIINCSILLTNSDNRNYPKKKIKGKTNRETNRIDNRRERDREDKKNQKCLCAVFLVPFKFQFILFTNNIHSLESNRIFTK